INMETNQEMTITVQNVPAIVWTGKVSKTCQKYLDLIKKRKFTKIEIQSFRKALNGCSTISLDEQELLKDTFYKAVESKRPINLTKEQTDFGIAWLRNKAFKLNGESRSNSPFRSREENVIKNFKKFEFSGLNDVSTNSYKNHQVVYKVIAKNGSQFEYTIYGGYGGLTIEIVG